MTLEDFQRAKEAPGYEYELIDGVLIVSPSPLPWHEHWVRHIRLEFEDYIDARPNRANCVFENIDVVVTGRPGSTRPRPDLAVFKDYPDPPPRGWEEVCPIVVVEVISERREKKDTVRNRHLYWMVGGIMEYLIVDTRKDEAKPTLIALVRKAGAVDWEERVIPYGKTYRSKALPGLTINLRRKNK